MKKIILILLFCSGCKDKYYTAYDEPSYISHHEVRIDELSTVKNTNLDKSLNQWYTIKSEVEHGDGNAEHNVRLAISKLNGYTIGTGSTFSFNKSVGERTAEAGFKEAEILFGGVKTPGMGGGVCQVSTSIYVAAMKAGLSVIERHPHSRPVSYAENGMDSAVNYPDLDLKIRNSTLDDIKIFFEIKDKKIIATLSLKEKPTELVDTKWLPSEPIPFKTGKISSKFANRELIVQKGEIGYPGYRIWTYPNGTLKVKSEYKPITRILVIPESM